MIDPRDLSEPEAMIWRGAFGAALNALITLRAQHLTVSAYGLEGVAIRRAALVREALEYAEYAVLESSARPSLELTEDLEEVAE